MISAALSGKFASAQELVMVNCESSGVGIPLFLEYSFIEVERIAMQHSFTVPLAFLQLALNLIKSYSGKNEQLIFLSEGLGTKLLMQFSYIGNNVTLTISLATAKGEAKCIATICKNVGGVTLGNLEKSALESNVCIMPNSCTPSVRE